MDIERLHCGYVIMLHYSNGIAFGNVILYVMLISLYHSNNYTVTLL